MRCITIFVLTGFLHNQQLKVSSGYPLKSLFFSLYWNSKYLLKKDEPNGVWVITYTPTLPPPE